jgi:hypothetical protein
MSRAIPELTKYTEVPEPTWLSWGSRHDIVVRGRGPAKRAGEGNRTPDLLITNEPLCRLSYPGEKPLSDLLLHRLPARRLVARRSQSR